MHRWAPTHIPRTDERHAGARARPPTVCADERHPARDTITFATTRSRPSRPPPCGRCCETVLARRRAPADRVLRATRRGSVRVRRRCCRRPCSSGLRVGYGAIKSRRLDPFAGYLLLTFGLSLAVGLATTDPKLILVGNTLVNGLGGLIFLGSCVVGTPLTQVVGRAVRRPRRTTARARRRGRPSATASTFCCRRCGASDCSSRWLIRLVVIANALRRRRQRRELGDHAAGDRRAGVGHHRRRTPGAQPAAGSRGGSDAGTNQTPPRLSASG